MSQFPLIQREAPVSLVTPVIPLNFVYPGLSLAQIFSIVWAHRRLTILIVIMVLSLMGLALSLWPRTYTAMATLMVNYEVNDPSNGKELPIGQVGSYIATQVELMQTPEVLLAVVDRLKLTQNRDYTAGYTGSSGTVQEWVAKELSRNLSIYQGQMGSQLIYLSYSGKNPAEAAEVVNAVAEVYREQDISRSTGPPGERAKRYAQQLAELKAKVEKAQKDVSVFRQRNALIDGGGKASGDLALLGTLEEHLLDAQNARRAAEARASSDQAANDQVLSSSLVQTLKTQLVAAEAKLAQFNTLYTPNHPDVVELQAQVQEARRALASATRTYSSNASGTLSAAQRLEQSLQKAVAEQRAKVLARGQVHDDGAKFLLELESSQAVYKRALEAYDQVMFATSGHYTNVTFISRATPPVKPSKPKVLTGLILGCMAAAFFGLGIPLGLELLHRRVRCRDDLERHHGIPVLVEFGRLRMRGAA